MVHPPVTALLGGAAWYQLGYPDPRDVQDSSNTATRPNSPTNACTAANINAKAISTVHTKRVMLMMMLRAAATEGAESSESSRFSACRCTGATR